MPRFDRKVTRNKLKKIQGNNKIRGLFGYIQDLRRRGDYEKINKILSI